MRGTVVVFLHAGPSDIVRIVNGVQSPNIDAQGGKATFVLQTAITSNSSSSNSSSNSSSVAAAKQKSHVSPAMGSVYLNGLQCTRLPLKTADPSMQYQDCAASQWELDSNGTFILPILSSLSGATSGSSSSSAPFWNGDNSRGATGNSSSATVDDDIAAALRWLSCTSHYCCGLQVVPPGSEATPPTDEPAVGALDGPTDTNTTTGNATTGNTTTAVVSVWAPARTNSKLSIWPRRPAGRRASDAPSHTAAYIVIVTPWNCTRFN